MFTLFKVNVAFKYIGHWDKAEVEMTKLNRSIFCSNAMLPVKEQ